MEMLPVPDQFRASMINAGAAALAQSVKTLQSDVKSFPLLAVPPVPVTPPTNTSLTTPATEVTPAKSEVDISINSLIGGMLLGCLCSLTTVSVVALVLVVATNQAFPEAVAESIGYKYPFRALQGFLTWVWTKVSSHMQVQASNLQSKED